MKSINLNVNPIQLSYFAKGMELEKNERLEKRRVYDYELEFIDRSLDGREYINGKIYHVKEDDIVFRKPGDVTQAIMKYSCYLIGFDLSNQIKIDIPKHIIRETGKIQKLSKDRLTNGLETLTHTSNPEYFKKLFSESIQNILNYNSLSIIKIKANILRILYTLYEEQKIITDFQSPYYNNIKKVKEYMINNLSNKITLEKMASMTGFSKNYFHEIFTKEMKKTPIEYLSELRLQKAKLLLVYSNYQIKKISSECGFNSYAYFSSFFKKKTDISPLEFRNNFRLY